MFDATKLSAKELTEEARNLGVPGWDKMKRPALEEAVSKAKDKKDKKAKKGKKEKDETFNQRKQRHFLKLIGMKEAIKYASPIATTSKK